MFSRYFCKGSFLVAVITPVLWGERPGGGEPTWGKSFTAIPDPSGTCLKRCVSGCCPTSVPKKYCV